MKDYHLALTQAIVNSGFEINEVFQMEIIGVFGFKRDDYQTILSTFKDGEIQKILDNWNEKNSREDLTIVKFKDQNNNNRLALIYDSDELWQDPQVIDVIIGK